MCTQALTVLISDWQSLTPRPVFLTSTSSSVSPRHFFHRSQPLLAILQLSLSRLTPSAAWLPLVYPFTLQLLPEPSSHGPALVRVQQISSSSIHTQKKKGAKEKKQNRHFSDEVQGSISQEALHFHLGAKWFWEALRVNVKRLKSVRFIYFCISRTCLLKGFVKPQLFVCDLAKAFIQTLF